MSAGSLPDVVLPVADPFLASARLAGELAASDEVTRRWTAESACSGMSVGGLAHHLAAQAGTVVRLLGAAPADQAPISIEEHYRRAAWVGSGFDGEVNVAIRTGADREAEGGYDALVARVRLDLESLPGTLAAGAVRAPDAVLIPWQGWALTTHDFLVTRLMEIVVHADDLAVSLDAPTPQFPNAAVRLVLGLLTSVAVERHGQTMLVRALSRPDRAPGSVSAF